MCCPPFCRWSCAASAPPGQCHCALTSWAEPPNLPQQTRSLPRCHCIAPTAHRHTHTALVNLLGGLEHCAVDVQVRVTECVLQLPVLDASCQDARCICRQAADKGCDKFYPLMDWPDPCKTRSIVGILLAFNGHPHQPGNQGE